MRAEPLPQETTIREDIVNLLKLATHSSKNVFELVVMFPDFDKSNFEKYKDNPYGNDKGYLLLY